MGILDKMKQKAGKKKQEEKKEAAPKVEVKKEETEEEESPQINLVDIKEDTKAKHKETKIRLNKEQTVLKGDGQFIQSAKPKKEEPKKVRTTWEMKEQVKIEKKFNYEQEKEYFKPIGQEHLIPQAPKNNRFIQPGAAIKSDTLPQKGTSPKTIAPVVLTKQQQKELEMQRRLNGGTTPLSSASSNSPPPLFTRKTGGGEPGIQFKEGISFKKSDGNTTSGNVELSKQQQKERQMEEKIEMEGRKAPYKGSASSGLQRSQGTTQPPSFQVYQGGFKFAKSRQQESKTREPQKTLQQLKEEQQQKKLSTINSPTKSPQAAKPLTKP